MTFGAKALMGWALVGAAVLSSACGGRAAQKNNGEPSPAGSGNGGGAAMGDGGGAAQAAGGSALSGGASSAAGSAPILHCDHVVCPPIPATCTRIVQGPADCCPTCPDTGCQVCPELQCEEGTHAEMIPGDCCATCVADPPDACVTGHQVYDNLRAALLDKYGSTPCQNSAQCSILLEDNACSRVCNVVLPTQTAMNYLSNLDNYADGCATCEAPRSVECSPRVAACVNGKCVEAEAQNR